MNINDYIDVNGDVLLSKQLISDLVDGVNKIINPTTTTITTFENGWEGSITLSRYGDLVSIKGLLMKTGTVTNGTQLIVVPAGFRPSGIVPIAVYKGNISPYTSSFLFSLSNTGNLVLRTTDTIPSNQGDAYLNINQIYSV